MSLRSTFEGALDHFISGGDNAASSIKLIKQILKISDADLQVVNIVYNFVLPVAMILVIVFFLEGYVELTANGREVSKDQIMQSFVWLIIGIFMMSSAPTLTSALAVINNAALEKYSDAFSKDANGLNELASGGAVSISAGMDAMTPSGSAINATGSAITTGSAIDAIADTTKKIATKTLNLISVFFSVVIAMISWLLNKISQFVLTIILISTKIEILLRLTLLPIGMCSLGSPTYKNDAIKFLKKTLASMFYAAVIVIVVYIANTAAGNMMPQLADGDNAIINASGFLDVAIARMAGPFAALAAVSVAKSIANEAIGG